MQKEVNKVCVWKEKENGKGDVYIPSCLGKSSNGVNVWKLCKKRGITILELFRQCPYCGERVVVNAVKKENDIFYQKLKENK